MLNAIKRTLLRLNGKVAILNPINWIPKLMEGIAIEFNRLSDYKNDVLNSVVPHDNMNPDSIEDQNVKYGIPNYLTGTDAEKIDRIIERAALTGNGGPDWFEEQIQKAGFPLYVHENVALIDPATVAGELIVGSFPGAITYFNGIMYGQSVYGLNQYREFDFSRVQGEYEITSDSTYWGFYFFLSPSPAGIVTAGNELVLTEQEWNYFYKLVISLKYQRNWCIAQVVVP